MLRAVYSEEREANFDIFWHFSATFSTLLNAFYSSSPRCEPDANNAIPCSILQLPFETCSNDNALLQHVLLFLILVKRCIRDMKVKETVDN